MREEERGRVERRRERRGGREGRKRERRKRGVI